jgi:hypothetical protein
LASSTLQALPPRPPSPAIGPSDEYLDYHVWTAIGTNEAFCITPNLLLPGFLLSRVRLPAISRFRNGLEVPRNPKLQRNLLETCNGSCQFVSQSSSSVTFGTMPFLQEEYHNEVFLADIPTSLQDRLLFAIPKSTSSFLERKLVSPANVLTCFQRAAFTNLASMSFKAQT